ncbi:MAG: MFS transporter [Theionarchaea archaeon]|nr:MFS transporter [Theionarchaea archaeon]MBU6999398.1 MFS transporter [Theionarchaea archaeon]MBU7021335.1 MFS transporter [Theionarchaea archaeon]MBU7036182.1 MFS transporter [Theionarchaea archaeon]MBU7041501.1 MFS transporter [Theionarchaea archaeon]
MDARMKRVVAATFMGHFVDDGLVLMLPLLIPYIAHDFNLSYTQIGIFGGSLVLTLGFGQILAGYVSDFSKVKWPFISFGLAVLSLSLFAMSFCSSYNCLILLNLLAGFGASFYHPCGIALLVKSMKEKIRGKILGVHGVGGGIGILMYPVCAGIILNTWGWHEVLFILPLTGLVSAVLFFFVKEEPSSHRGRKQFPLIQKESILMCILFGCFAMFFRGFVTFLPVQLEEIGFSTSSVTGAITLFYATGIIAELLAGILTDMYSRKKIICVSMLAASVLVLVLFHSVWVFLVPLGFVLYVVWVPATASYVEGIPEAWYGTALGLVQGLGGLMAASSPVIMGVIAERNGVPASFFLLVAIGVVGAIVALKLKSD